MEKMSIFNQVAGITSIFLLGFAAVPAKADFPSPDWIRTDAQQLAVITNDHNSDINDLFLLLDSEGQVEGIRFDTQHANSDSVTSEDFTLDEIESDAGAVLVHEEGYDAVILKGEIDSVAGKGDLTVSYLSDGLMDSYSDCSALLRRDGKQRWQLINSTTGAIITRMRIRTWSMGISTIEGLCPSNQ